MRSGRRSGGKSSLKGNVKSGLTSGSWTGSLGSREGKIGVMNMMKICKRNIIGVNIGIVKDR